jgi:hypothetical protein
MFRIENDSIMDKVTGAKSMKSEATRDNIKKVEPKPEVVAGELVLTEMPSVSLDERAHVWFRTHNRPDWAATFDLDNIFFNRKPKDMVVVESILAVGLASSFSTF